MEKDILFQNIIDQYTEPLFKRASYLLSHNEDAEDIVQEVFIAAYESYHKYKGDSSIKTWLMAILNNKISDQYRKKYKQITPISLDHYFENDGTWKKDQIPESWNTDDDPLVNNIDFNNVLAECIDKLPPKWNIPIKLYYLEEKKTETLSQELGLSTTNIWKILQRGRLQLRECLDRNWFKN